MNIIDNALKGSYIWLEFLNENHRQELKKLSEDPNVSTYSPTLRLEFDKWFNKALNQENSQHLSFVVRTLTDNKIVGSTRFYDIEAEHKRLAIGYTWYIPSVWGTKVNAECKLLLLQYAFEVMGMHRIAFFVDQRNERSLAAVKKLGATLEGILRKDIILDDGYVRDTVVLSIIDSEWERIHSQLKERLETIARKQ